jgi:hypothetical protein
MECQTCGRAIDPNIGECRWSDCPSNQITCAICGAKMSVHDQVCTTYWGRGRWRRVLRGALTSEGAGFTGECLCPACFEKRQKGEK